MDFYSQTILLILLSSEMIMSLLVLHKTVLSKEEPALNSQTSQ